MKFQVLSHAGLKVEGAGRQLIFDPWLIGSVYWRSWWNYPPVSREVIEGLKPDFIYLTHIHWDHYQGPSLRLFPRDTCILLPYDHNPRPKADLLQMGFRNVLEIKHGQAHEIGKDFRITSYQFYPFTDSAAVIECEGQVILNANDAKFMGGPLDQILNRHPRIDFVMRSHSSANPRVCYDFLDSPNPDIEDRQRYLRDFADFAVKTGAKYAVPFASNHCFLHREVFRFNNTVTTPVEVEKYFRNHGIRNPEVKVMITGDSWSSETGFSLSSEDWFTDRDVRLSYYAAEKAPILDKFYAQEARADVTLESVRKYFRRFRSALAWPLRRVFKGRPITYVLSGKQTRIFEVDLHRGTAIEVLEVGNAAQCLQIHTSSFIFRQCMALNLFLYLGISKRVVFRCRKSDAKYLWFLEFLFNLYECDMLPLRRMLKPRFIFAWVPRWREILLYAGILSKRAVGRPFSLSDYLATQTRKSFPAAPSGNARD